MNNFEKEVSDRLTKVSKNAKLKKSAADFMADTITAKYSYNFFWLGRPIIQYPQDMVAIQELIWEKRPDIIVETGIAHGGSLILSASILALLDMCEATENNSILDPSKPKRRVIGVDVDIRDHNRAKIEAHPLANRISMIEGSSIDQDIFSRVKASIGDGKRVMVFLDSNHTHEHVLDELRLYSSLVSKNSYIVVFDTVVEDLPKSFFGDRPWSPGNNPKTAVLEFLDEINQNNFYSQDGDLLSLQVDKQIENKLLITVAPSGYLKRV